MFVHSLTLRLMAISVQISRYFCLWHNNFWCYTQWVKIRKNLNLAQRLKILKKNSNGTAVKWRAWCGVNQKCQKKLILAFEVIVQSSDFYYTIFSIFSSLCAIELRRYGDCDWQQNYGLCSWLPRRIFRVLSLHRQGHHLMSWYIIISDVGVNWTFRL